MAASRFLPIVLPNLAARSNPLAVFAGSVLALWLIAALAVTLGAKSLDLIPMAWVRRITATILLALVFTPWSRP